MEMTLYGYCIIFSCFLLNCYIIQVYASQDRGDLYFPEGRKIELRCKNITTEGHFVSVYWYSTAYATNGTEITDVYRYDITEKTHINHYFKKRIERINETSIRIKDARLSDSGRWKCDILYNNNGLKYIPQASYTVHIVSAPHEIDIQPPVSVMGNIGGTATVFCESNSLSPFTLSWYKKIGNFTNNANIRVERKHVEGYYIRRAYLQFSSLSKEDTGVYFCVAKNVGGQHNNSVTVRIKSTPQIIGNNETITKINVHESGKLICKAKGYPKIKFQWKVLDKNNLLGANQKTDHLSVSTTVYSSRDEVGFSVLTINVVSKEYFGKYTCIATNIAGYDNRDVTLEGIGPPDPPSIIKNLVKTEENQITIYWTLAEEKGAPTKSVTIEHRNSSSSKNSWTRYAINKAIRTYTVSSLVKGTLYDFRIRASNKIGNSKYSKIVKISTKGDEELAPPSTGNAGSDFGDDDLTTLIGIFGGAFIALLVGFICVCVFVRRMQKHDQNETQHVNVTTSYAPTTLPQQTSVDGRPPIMLEMEPLVQNYQVDHWEFPRDRLTVTTVLGAGAFGVVMRGLALGIKGSVGKITVAVKTVRDNTNEAATKDLVAELNLLKLLPEHPNVVGLLGACTRAEPIYVIVEYCANGDLQGFLRSSRGIYERYYKTSYGGAVPNLTCKMLLTFAWQIAKGMNHLSSMKVIHRDLAARNILVDDQLVCKVSDFGFARDIYVEDHYLKRSAGGRFPIKWMAIESLLDGISTTKSDVWSFGVVLWELVTLGASPYPGMNSYEVVSFLQDGYRMDKPKHCSNEIYQLMMDCWNVAPGRRPSFNDLAERARGLIDESEDKELINMNFYPDHLYVNFDGAGSQSASVSQATTPHGTLTRNHVVNMHQDQLANGNVPSSPRSALRSASGHTIRNGRTNSVTALSERSVTGASSSSYNGERLLPNNNKTPSAERIPLVNGSAAKEGLS